MRGQSVKSAAVLLGVMERSLASIGGNEMAPNFTHAGCLGVASRENQEARAPRALREFSTVDFPMGVAALALAAALVVGGM